jgi:ferric-dicitrate binding protein FerR (iron transport regulator)
MVEREKALASDLTPPAAAPAKPAADPAAPAPRRGDRHVGIYALAAIMAFVVFFVLADLWQAYFAP